MSKRHRNEHEVDLEACADALYTILSKRASSYDALDVEVNVNDGHVDGEVHFSAGADVGVTIDVAAGTAQVCTLVGDNEEEWSDDIVSGLKLVAVSEEDLKASLQPVVRAMLDLRRPDGPKADAAEGDAVVDEPAPDEA